MARVRSKTGKKTHGQYGDICATDPSGNPLIKVFTIELKRGYKNANVHDLLDKMKSMKQPPFEHWLEQVVSSWQEAESMSWMLITRRDRHDAIVMIPEKIRHQLQDPNGALAFGAPVATMLFKTEELGYQNVFIVKLEEFLRVVTPKQIKKLAKRC